jgi:hypothetical protein
MIKSAVFFFFSCLELLNKNKRNEFIFQRDMKRIMEVYTNKIEKYFNELVNEIDAKVVQLNSRYLNKEDILLKINEARVLFVEEVRTVEFFNLESLEKLAVNDLKTDDSDAKLFKSVCFFVDKDIFPFETDASLGYLITVGDFIPKNQILLCKEIMKSFNEQIELSQENPFFRIKREKVSFTRVDIYLFINSSLILRF